MATILVVEDSPTVSKTMEFMLQQQGYTVRIASNGLVALTALRVYKPDLVLLDILLPHVDGYQICLVMRRMPHFSNTPIIMVSGLSNESDIQHALKSGANDYIVKPVEKEKLLSVIKTHLSRGTLTETNQ